MKHLKGVDPQRRLMLRILRVEVGWSMVIVVHRSGDAEELADARHVASTYYPRPGFRGPGVVRTSTDSE